MELRPELRPPVLDETLVNKLAELADKLSANVRFKHFNLTVNNAKDRMEMALVEARA